MVDLDILRASVDLFLCVAPQDTVYQRGVIGVVDDDSVPIVEGDRGVQQERCSLISLIDRTADRRAVFGDGRVEDRAVRFQVEPQCTSPRRGGSGGSVATNRAAFDSDSPAFSLGEHASAALGGIAGDIAVHEGRPSRRLGRHATAIVRPIGADDAMLDDRRRSNAANSSAPLRLTVAQSEPPKHREGVLARLENHHAAAAPGIDYRRRHDRWVEWIGASHDDPLPREVDRILIVGSGCDYDLIAIARRSDRLLNRGVILRDQDRGAWGERREREAAKEGRDGAERCSIGKGRTRLEWPKELPHCVCSGGFGVPWCDDNRITASLPPSSLVEHPRASALSRVLGIPREGHVDLARALRPEAQRQTPTGRAGRTALSSDRRGDAPRGARS